MGISLAHFLHQVFNAGHNAEKAVQHTVQRAAQPVANTARATEQGIVNTVHPAVQELNNLYHAIHPVSINPNPGVAAGVTLPKPPGGDQSYQVYNDQQPQSIHLNAVTPSLPQIPNSSPEHNYIQTQYWQNPDTDKNYVNSPWGVDQVKPDGYSSSGFTPEAYTSPAYKKPKTKKPRGYSI